MPNPSPSARYDSPWKAVLAHALRPFMAFFYPQISARIDWSGRPRVRDKELAGISFGSRPDGLIADHLVEVRLRGGSVQSMLVHVEVQAQRDTSLARRMFDYNYRIHRQHAQPVVSLVVLADEDPKWRPQAWHSRVPGAATWFFFSSVKLLDYARRTDELLKSRNPFALITLAHLRTQQTRRDPGRRYLAK